MAGRIIRYWRVKSASVGSRNVFDMGEYPYEIVADRSNRKWPKGLGKPGLITIIRKTAPAKAGSYCMRAIGTNYDKSVNISGNRVSGVVDDITGVRFCDDVKIAGD